MTAPFDRGEDVIRPLIPTWAERLNQGEVWHNGLGTPIPLETMDRAYRINVLNWIYRNAPRIAQTVLWRLMFTTPPRGEAAMDDLEAAMDRLERDPLGWIIGTKLVTALLGDDLGSVWAGGCAVPHQHGGHWDVRLLICGRPGAVNMSAAEADHFARRHVCLGPDATPEPDHPESATPIETRVDGLVQALECWCPADYVDGGYVPFCPRHAVGPKLAAAILQLVR